MRNLTVGKLRELIKDLPDDMPVLTHGSDHSYNKVAGYLTDAAWEDGNDFFYEYHGDEHLAKDELKIKVVLISDW